MSLTLSKKSGLLNLQKKSGNLVLEARSVFPVVTVTLTMRQVLTLLMGNVSRDGGIFEGEKCALINLYVINDEDIEAFKARVLFDDDGSIFESESCLIGKL